MTTLKAFPFKNIIGHETRAFPHIRNVEQTFESLIADDLRITPGDTTNHYILSQPSSYCDSKMIRRFSDNNNFENMVDKNNQISSESQTVTSESSNPYDVVNPGIFDFTIATYNDFHQNPSSVASCNKYEKINLTNIDTISRNNFAFDKPLPKYQYTGSLCYIYPQENPGVLTALNLEETSSIPPSPPISIKSNIKPIINTSNNNDALQSIKSSIGSFSNVNSHWSSSSTDISQIKSRAPPLGAKFTPPVIQHSDEEVINVIDLDEDVAIMTRSDRTSLHDVNESKNKNQRYKSIINEIDLDEDVAIRTRTGQSFQDKDVAIMTHTDRTSSHDENKSTNNGNELTGSCHTKDNEQQQLGRSQLRRQKLGLITNQKVPGRQLALGCSRQAETTDQHSAGFKLSILTPTQSVNNGFKRPILTSTQSINKKQRLNKIPNISDHNITEPIKTDRIILKNESNDENSYASSQKHNDENCISGINQISINNNSNEKSEFGHTNLHDELITSKKDLIPSDLSLNNPINYLNDIKDIKSESLNDDKNNNNTTAASQEISYGKGCDVQKFRRLAANARERRRMDALNDAFDKLRDVLPQVQIM